MPADHIPATFLVVFIIAFGVALLCGADRDTEIDDNDEV